MMSSLLSCSNRTRPHDNIDSACVCAVLKTTKLAVLSETSDVTCTYSAAQNVFTITLADLAQTIFRN
jgi:hypothetical protein